jgi:hypothetical protein
MANLSNINNKFLVTTGGNVGINSTGPNEKLEVGGSIRIDNGASFTSYQVYRDNIKYGDVGGGGNQFTIQASNNKNINLFDDSGVGLTVKDGGNVGIGTDSPSFKLDVSGDGIRSIRSTAGWAGWFENTGDSSGVVVTAGRTSGHAPLLIRKEDGTELFSVRGNGTSYFNNGNVGIGTNGPQALLDVEKNNSVIYNPADDLGQRSGTATIHITNQTATINTFGQLMYDSRTSGQGIARIVFLDSGSASVDMAFVTEHSDVKSEKMRIASDGNVGIGTNDPQSKLEVATSDNINDISDGAIQVVSSSPIAFVAPSNLNPSLNRWGFTLREGGEGHFGIRDYRHSSTRVTIDDGGNVGIGTDSPSATEPIGGNLPIGWTRAGSKALEIAAPDFASTGLFLRNSDTTATGTDITGDHYYGDTYIDNRFNNDNGSIYFRTKTAVSPQIRMAIKGSGNVGIGTQGPPSKLTVMESTLCTNSGTDGGTSYVPTKPILLVTTDGNGTPSGYYATNSVFTVGIGGGITGNVTTEHLRVNLNGNVGIGTDSPSEKLTIPGNYGVGLGYKTFYSSGGTVPAGIGPSNYLVATLNQLQGTTLTSKHQYKFFLTTTGTGTYNSSVYIVYANSNNTAWVVREVSRRGTTSNHPELTVSGTEARIYNDHPSSYGVLYRVETTNSNQANTAPEIFGSDYMWQRTAGRLSYTDGEVVISGASYSDGANNISLNQGLVKIGSATTTGTVSMYFTNPNGVVGSVVTDGSNTQFNTSSDYRLKENVVEITGALDRVSQLKPSRFNFIADADKTVDGFLAHEVQEIVPEAITGIKDGVDEKGNPEYQGIDQSKLVPLLVAAIQELKAEIELLKSK